MKLWISSDNASSDLDYGHYYVQLFKLFIALFILAKLLAAQIFNATGAFYLKDEHITDR